MWNAMRLAYLPMLLRHSSCMQNVRVCAHSAVLVQRCCCQQSQSTAEASISRPACLPSKRGLQDAARVNPLIARSGAATRHCYGMTLTYLMSHALIPDLPRVGREGSTACCHCSRRCERSRHIAEQ